MRFCLCLSGAQHYHKNTIHFLIFAWTTIQILTSCDTLVRTLVNTQAYTFATLQKRPLLSIKTYEILTQAGPKNHAKNVAIFLNRALEGRGEGEAAVPVCRASSLASSSSFGRPNLIYFWFIDPASDHMLVSKTKQCMSQYELRMPHESNSSLFGHSLLG